MSEKILNKEKPYLFTIMVFLSAISNFYFFYMMTILVFIFTVITYFLNYKNITAKAFFQLLGKFILYYVIGVALSLFLFLPVVIYLYEATRVWAVPMRARRCFAVLRITLNSSCGGFHRAPSMGKRWDTVYWRLSVSLACF